MPIGSPAKSSTRVAQWAFLALLGASLPGCQIWNAWLDALKWRMDDKTTKQAATPTLPGPSYTTPANGLIPRVTVYRISLPIGSFSTNEKIWAQLNEDAIDSKTAVLMAQNGLRAATGAISRWPTISGLLDVPGATTDPFLCQTDGRSSINVVTRPGLTDEMVVSIDRDLQQQMRSFDRCDNGFRLSMRADKKGPNQPELLIQLDPIVTLGTVEVTRTGNDMGITRSGFTSEESFADLHMAALLTAEQFLVVCAMDPNTSPFSVRNALAEQQRQSPRHRNRPDFRPRLPPRPPPQIKNKKNRKVYSRKKKDGWRPPWVTPATPRPPASSP